MSKLLNIYKKLKSENNDTLYLFKSGIFYIFLDEDAKKINKILNLKLTNFTDNVVKCGFPSSAINKYSNLLNQHDFRIEIIDTNNISTCNFKDFNKNESFKHLVNSIKQVDIDNLSVSEAYKFIEDLKMQVNKY